MDILTPDNLLSEEGDTKRPRVQSVARAASILFMVAQDPRGLSRKDISKNARVSTQATYHLLHTLTQMGLVARNEEGNYVLGLRIGSLAEGFRRQLSGTSQIATLIRSIARETGETTYAAKWINGEVVSIDIVRGHHQIQALEVPYGFSEDAHSRAGGKALLANLTDDQRQEYFASHKLRRRTPHTVTSVTALEKQFADIRRIGYAIEREEFAPGLACVGMPLDAGLSPYAIGISAPIDRFDLHFDEYLKVLQDSIADTLPSC